MLRLPFSQPCSPAQQPAAIQRHFGFVLRFGILMVAGANTSTPLTASLLQRHSPLQKQAAPAISPSHYASGICESGIVRLRSLQVWRLKRESGICESGIWNLKKDTIVLMAYCLNSFVVSPDNLYHFICTLKSIIQRKAQTCISDQFCNRKRPRCIFQKTVSLL